jgi:hypothetical protein
VGLFELIPITWLPVTDIRSLSQAQLIGAFQHFHLRIETDPVSKMCSVSRQWTDSRNQIFLHVAEILLKCDKCLDGLKMISVTHRLKVSVQDYILADSKWASVPVTSG